jgi:uncharacterized repeat protein (TIGR01451 family)
VNRARLALGFLVLGASVAALAAQPDVLLEKRTNGQDADSPPGPVVLVGSPIAWTYVVTNSGSRDLTNILVTDDQGVTVTCPSTTLGAGESMTCTASGTAVAGQYANIGTVNAQLPDSSEVSASDPSHYFGQAQVVVTLEKSTNGLDADTPPGPILAVGDPVNWTYVVTNVGTDPLSNILVTDSQGVSVSCPSTTLAAGASMTCTASGVVEPGQYVNVGGVLAMLPDESPAGALDSSHYYGQSLLLEKQTNGLDAEFPPGPTLIPGATVTWTYRVTNPGPATVTGLTVTDDQIGPIVCPQTALASDESVTCSAAGVAQPGQYANVATATAQLPSGGGTVTATDLSHYFGNVLRLEKATNGVDADLPPGPVVAIGSAVSWTYVVTNLSADTLTNVAVVDSQGVTVACPGTTLTAGQSMTCTASDTAVAGQYSNEGVATADHPTLGQISASDFSHYFGQNQVLDFGDASGPFFPTTLAEDGARHLLGSGVYLGACVDSELDGQPTAGADGDDLGVGIFTFGTCATPGDDENGVTFTTQLIAGTTAGIDVVANEACTLSAWIDFNRDGDWIDPNENIFPGGVALAAGVNSLTFGVPASVVEGAAAARFRCTTAGPISFSGEAPDGEVEDYMVALAATPASVSASKTVALLVDQASNGQVDPGDTLAYTVTLVNSGGAIATGVVFTDTPDVNTTLVVGSVTTSAGTVVLGNTAGNTSVQVDVGDLAGGGGTATIVFHVMVNDPLPSGVEVISNQGLVAGDNFASAPTDDPGVPGAADPTVIGLDEPPSVSASKAVALAVDQTGDGHVDPGDTLIYTVVLVNNGGMVATGVVFTDTPDVNTTLVVGSVTTSAGTVVLGNTAGDTSVRVDVGSLAGGGGTATITYRVTVNAPLPEGVHQISNQGLVAGDNFPDTSTDDSATPGGGDPTVIQLDELEGAIPVASTWGLLTLLLLLAALGFRRLASYGNRQM